MNTAGAGHREALADDAVDAPAPVRRIGIFGGSFDPVHDAHLALARIAREHLSLDEVRWVPVGTPWQKTRALAPAEDRVEMVEAAIRGEPGFTLDRIEVDRAGPSYTIDTVRSLQQSEPGHLWWLLLGQDQYAHFDTWHGWEELLDRVVLAVAGRDGDPVHTPEALARRPHRVSWLPLPRIDISATTVRDAVGSGRGIDAMVPAPVARYIDQHRLYRRTT